MLYSITLQPELYINCVTFISDLTRNIIIRAAIQLRYSKCRIPFSNNFLEVFVFDIYNNMFWGYRV